jgi:hypothetical protein
MRSLNLGNQSKDEQMFTRESLMWWVGLLGGLVVALATLDRSMAVETFGIPEKALPYLRLVAFLLTTGSAWAKTSPFPSKQDPPSSTPAGSVNMNKVGPFLLLVALGLDVSSCASGGARHIVTVTAVSADAVLSHLQDTEHALVCGTAGAPTVPVCVPADVHKTVIAPALSKGFDADGRLAKLIRETPPNVTPPATLGQLIDDINAAIARVLEAIPESSFKASLVAKLGGK